MRLADIPPIRLSCADQAFYQLRIVQARYKKVLSANDYRALLSRIIVPFPKLVKFLSEDERQWFQ